MISLEFITLKKSSLMERIKYEHPSLDLEDRKEAMVLMAILIIDR
jgi:hypothetical protein